MMTQQSPGLLLSPPVLISPSCSTSRVPPSPYRKEFNKDDPEFIQRFAAKLIRGESYTLYIRNANSWHDVQKEIDKKLKANKYSPHWRNWCLNWTKIITTILVADLHRQDSIRDIDRTDNPLLLEPLKKKFWKYTAKLNEALAGAKAAISKDDTYFSASLKKRWESLNVFASSLRIDAFGKGYFIEYEKTAPQSERNTRLDSGTFAIHYLTLKEYTSLFKSVKDSKEKSQLDTLNKEVYTILQKIIAEAIPLHPTLHLPLR